MIIYCGTNPPIERRSRVFYCRECGEVFTCKHQHITHIRLGWRIRKILFRFGFESYIYYL
jgi:hypothetical protein